MKKILMAKGSYCDRRGRGAPAMHPSLDLTLKCLCSYLPLYNSSHNTGRSGLDRFFLPALLFCPSLNRLNRHFNHCFADNTCNLWNELPDDLQSANSPTCFSLPRLSTIKVNIAT